MQPILQSMRTFISSLCQLLNNLLQDASITEFDAFIDDLPGLCHVMVFYTITYVCPQRGNRRQDVFFCDED